MSASYFFGLRVESRTPEWWDLESNAHVTLGYYPRLSVGRANELRQQLTSDVHKALPIELAVTGLAQLGPKLDVPAILVSHPYLNTLRSWAETARELDRTWPNFVPHVTDYDANPGNNVDVSLRKAVLVGTELFFSESNR